MLQIRQYPKILRVAIGCAEHGKNPHGAQMTKTYSYTLHTHLFRWSLLMSLSEQQDTACLCRRGNRQSIQIHSCGSLSTRVAANVSDCIQPTQFLVAVGILP